MRRMRYWDPELSGTAELPVPALLPLLMVLKTASLVQPRAEMRGRASGMLMVGVGGGGNSFERSPEPEDRLKRRSYSEGGGGAGGGDSGGAGGDGESGGRGGVSYSTKGGLGVPVWVQQTRCLKTGSRLT